jgi:hypothetical protein
MVTKEYIEDIVSEGLKGLCTKCVHMVRCSYHRQAGKVVIQCELYEMDDETSTSSTPVKGLCKNCDHATRCSLPGRVSGVWHCNEYR